MPPKSVLFTLEINDRVTVVKNDSRNWSLRLKDDPQLTDGGAGGDEEGEEGWTTIGYYGSLSTALTKLVSHRPELLLKKDMVTVRDLRKHLDEVLLEVAELAERIETASPSKETRSRKSDPRAGLRIDRAWRSCHTPLRKDSTMSTQIQIQELEARVKASPLLDPSEVHTLRAIYHDKRNSQDLREKANRLLSQTLLHPRGASSRAHFLREVRPFLLARCNSRRVRGIRR